MTFLHPSTTARVGAELGIEQGWCKYLGQQGVFLGMNDYGASAPAEVLMKHFGFTVENVCHLAKQVMK